MVKSKFIPPLPPLRTNEVEFSELVIEAISTAAHSLAAKTFAAHAAQPTEFALLQKPTIEDPEISLQESKAMIITALHNFDPTLGAKAAAMLQNEKVLNITAVPAGTAYMMRCRPAGYTNLGEENPESHPIIDLDYDHTIQSTVYLAHELGHAIADDYQREAGNDFETNPTHMIETQAYLVQNIVYNHLKSHPDKNIATAAQRFSTAEMTKNIYDMSLAQAANDALTDSSRNKSPNPAVIFGTRFGEGWESFITAYPPAQSVFDAIADLKTAQNTENPVARQRLKNEAQRLHERPTSILIAACITAHLATQDTEQRQKTSETLLGRNGAKNITDTLKVAGLDKGLNNLAQSTLTNLTAWLQTAEDKSQPLKLAQKTSASAPTRHAS